MGAKKDKKKRDWHAENRQRADRRAAIWKKENADKLAAGWVPPPPGYTPPSTRRPGKGKRVSKGKRAKPEGEPGAQGGGAPRGERGGVKQGGNVHKPSGGVKKPGGANRRDGGGHHRGNGPRVVIHHYHYHLH